MNSKLPYKTFDLYNSYNAELPFVERLYKWITSVGRYIVIGVEMVVLVAFIARFFLDQSLNDITEKINNNNTTLVASKPDETYVKNIISKIEAVKAIDLSNPKLTLSNPDYNKSLINEIPNIYKITPINISLKSISYQSPLLPTIPIESLTLIISAKSDVVPQYENDLSQKVFNPANVLPNSNIELKELRISTGPSGISDYTLKLTRIK